MEFLGFFFTASMIPKIKTQWFWPQSPFYLWVMAGWTFFWKQGECWPWSRVRTISNSTMLISPSCLLPTENTMGNWLIYLNTFYFSSSTKSSSHRAYFRASRESLVSLGCPQTFFSGWAIFRAEFLFLCVERANTFGLLFTLELKISFQISPNGEELPTISSSLPNKLAFSIPK